MHLDFVGIPAAMQGKARARANSNKRGPRQTRYKHPVSPLPIARRPNLVVKVSAEMRYLAQGTSYVAEMTDRLPALSIVTRSPHFPSRVKQVLQGGPKHHDLIANIGRLGRVGVQASPAVFRGTLKAGAKLWNTARMRGW